MLSPNNQLLNSKHFEFLYSIINMTSAKDIKDKIVLEESDELLSGLFVSDTENFISINPDISNLSELFEMKDPIHKYFTIDEQASKNIMKDYDSFKKFITKVASSIIRNKNTTIKMVCDNYPIIILVDIIYGFLLSYGKQYNVEGLVNVGKLKFIIDDDQQCSANLALFKAVVDKVLITEVLDSVRYHNMANSYNPNSEFYKKTQDLCDFGSRGIFNSCSLSNCFYSCDITSDRPNVFKDIFDLNYELSIHSEVVVEIQSSFMYKVNRFKDFQFQLLKAILQKNFNLDKILPDVDSSNIIELVDSYVEQCKELIKFNAPLFVSQKALEDILLVMEKAKTDLKQSVG